MEPGEAARCARQAAGGCGGTGAALEMEEEGDVIMNETLLVDDEAGAAPENEAEAAAMEESLAGMEARLRGMSSSLLSLRPTIAHSTDARLMYVLASDEASPTGAPYPKGHAPRLLPDGADAPLRLARVRGELARLTARMAPFMTVDLPGQNDDNLQAHATPVGFLAMHGCDAVWNGRHWETMPGALNTVFQGVAEEDVVIDRAEFPPQAGLLHLRIQVRYGIPVDEVRVLGAQIAFAPAGSHASTTADIGLDVNTESWTAGTVISPLAWLMPPTNERRAPVVLRLGNGQFPVEHDFSRPIGWGGLQPLDV